MGEGNVRESETRCPTCGTPHRAEDRYCAQCGAALPLLEPDAPPRTAIASPAPEETAGEATPTAPAEREERPAWLFAARPATVIGGGALLLLLAGALLVIGQRDTTGTIVMLSFCLAPLALLTAAIGVVRLAVDGRRKPEGGRTSRES
jgi:hypothetical protein